MIKQVMFVSCYYWVIFGNVPFPSFPAVPLGTSHHGGQNAGVFEGYEPPRGGGGMSCGIYYIYAEYPGNALKRLLIKESGNYQSL